MIYLNNLKSLTLSSLLLLIKVIILLNIFNVNRYKNAITKKTTRKIMNAEDDNLPTIADSSAKDASEIGKENFFNIAF